MSDGSYHFETDIDRNYLRLNLAGMWNQRLATAFLSDLEQTIRGMLGAGARYGEFRTLVDMSRKNILPQDAVAEFQSVIRPDSPSRRIALIVSGPLHKMQTKRIAISDKHRIFDREGDALEWLWADG